VPLDALALALAAAVLHAVWNLLLAGAKDVEAATAVALPVSVIVVAPAAIVFWRVDSGAWPFIAASAGLELVYFTLLAASYRRAELSVVYPLARGLAPVFVLLGALVFTGADTTTQQVLGVLLVTGGVLFVRGFRRGRGVGFGLVIACCIAAYTVVDKHGVAHASPLAYLEVVTAAMGFGYCAGFTIVRGPAALRAGWGWRPVVAGLASFLAYALVLWALQLASAASVAAVRETGVLFATGLAAWFLKERVTRWRFAGAALVVGGIALLSL
jgi:drug/metabolite transporter (DMT)-like permease